MRAVCVVQARLGSTRLPGKVLMPFGNMTVLGSVLSRCKQIRGVDQVVCAIPDEPRSEKIEEEALKFGIVSYRGPEDDVLTRYYLAATATDADAVMRITADCPLIDPNVCWQVLKKFYRDRTPYISNVLPRTYPRGLDCEVFSFKALEQAFTDARQDYDREHVTPFIQRYFTRDFISGPGPDGTPLTIDTTEDYERLVTLENA